MKQYIKSFFVPNTDEQEKRNNVGENSDTQETSQGLSISGNSDKEINNNGSSNCINNISASRLSIRTPKSNISLSISSPRSRPRLLSRSVPVPKMRHLSGSACGMTLEELEEHVNVLRTSRHTFLPHMAHILRKLMEHNSNRGLFNEPVRIAGYTDIIETPIDLQIIRSRLVSGEYTSIESFSKDVHLVFDNAIRYNPAGHAVNKSANKMKINFERLKNKAFQRMREEDENPLLRVLNLRTESSAATRNDKANKNKNKNKNRKCNKGNGQRNNQHTVNNTDTTFDLGSSATNIGVLLSGTQYETSSNNNVIETSSINNSSSGNKTNASTPVGGTITATTTSSDESIGGELSNNYMSYRKTNGTDPKNNVNFKERAGMICSLCNSGDLVLSIPVLRCGAPCNNKIARGANYYIAPTASPEGLSQHWCQRCYNSLPLEFCALYGIRMKKKRSNCLQK